MVELTKALLGAVEAVARLKFAADDAEVALRKIVSAGVTDDDVAEYQRRMRRPRSELLTDEQHNIPPSQRAPLTEGVGDEDAEAPKPEVTKIAPGHYVVTYEDNAHNEAVEAYEQQADEAPDTTRGNAEPTVDVTGLVMSLANTSKGVSVSELVAEYGGESKRYQRAISELIEAGQLTKTGQRKGTRYFTTEAKAAE